MRPYRQQRRHRRRWSDCQFSRDGRRDRQHHEQQHHDGFGRRGLELRRARACQRDGDEFDPQRQQRRARRRHSQCERDGDRQCCTSELHSGRELRRAGRTLQRRRISQPHAAQHRPERGSNSVPTSARRTGRPSPRLDSTSAAMPPVGNWTNPAISPAPIPASIRRSPEQWRPHSHDRTDGGQPWLINNGDNTTAPPADQRGFLRTAVSDIGAFEFGAVMPTPTSTPVPSATPMPTTTPTPGATPTPTPASSPTPTPSAFPSPTATPTPPLETKLGNIATRLRIETGDLRPDLRVHHHRDGAQEGDRAGDRSLGIRGRRALRSAAAREMSHGGGASFAFNDNWEEASNREEIIASTIAPTHPRSRPSSARLRPETTPRS